MARALSKHDFRRQLKNLHGWCVGFIAICIGIPVGLFLTPLFPDYNAPPGEPIMPAWLWYTLVILFVCGTIWFSLIKPIVKFSGSKNILTSPREIYRETFFSALRPGMVAGALLAFWALTGDWVMSANGPAYIAGIIAIVCSIKLLEHVSTRSFVALYNSRKAIWNDLEPSSADDGATLA